MQARLLNLDVRLCSIAKLDIQLRPVSLGKDGHRVARKASYARCCHGDTKKDRNEFGHLLITTHQQITILELFLVSMAISNIDQVPSPLVAIYTDLLLEQPRHERSDLIMIEGY